MGWKDAEQLGKVAAGRCPGGGGHGLWAPRGGGLRGSGTHAAQLPAPLVAEVIREAVDGRRGARTGLEGGISRPWGSPSFFGPLRERRGQGGAAHTEQDPRVRGLAPAWAPAGPLTSRVEDEDVFSFFLMIVKFWERECGESACPLPARRTLSSSSLHVLTELVVTATGGWMPRAGVPGVGAALRGREARAPVRTHSCFASRRRRLEMLAPRP